MLNFFPFFQLLYCFRWQVLHWFEPTYANPSLPKAGTVVDAAVTAAASPATAGKTHVTCQLDKIKPRHASVAITANLAFIVLPSTRKRTGRSTRGARADLSMARLFFCPQHSPRAGSGPKTMARAPVSAY